MRLRDMAWFLPSRLTLANLLFFTLLNMLTRLISSPIFYWTIRLAAVHHFHKWEKKLVQPHAPSGGWWGFIKTSFILPWLGARFADFGGLMTGFAFYMYSRKSSVADACYSVMDIPGLLKLNDPQFLTKSDSCDMMHNTTRSDIAAASSTFRFLYRSADIFANDIYDECRKMIMAFWAIDGGDKCSLNLTQDFTEKYLEAQELCLRLKGSYDEMDARVIRKAGQVAIDVLLGPGLEMRDVEGAQRQVSELEI